VLGDGNFEKMGDSSKNDVKRSGGSILLSFESKPYRAGWGETSREMKLEKMSKATDQHSGR